MGIDILTQFAVTHEEGSCHRPPMPGIDQSFEIAQVMVKITLHSYIVQVVLDFRLQLSKYPSFVRAVDHRKSPVRLSFGIGYWL